MNNSNIQFSESIAVLRPSGEKRFVHIRFLLSEFDSGNLSEMALSKKLWGYSRLVELVENITADGNEIDP